MAMAQLEVPRYTVDDLEQFPDDGNRYELLDGMLLVSPGPGQSHQLVATLIAAPMINALMLPGHAKVGLPGIVTQPPGTQLQPDILVYPSRFAADATWLEVDEHWLAVEILSRSTRVYDREFKRQAYFALGVQQVWLVDIRDRSVEVWHSPTTSRVVRDVIRWSVPTLDTIVSIDLAHVFAGFR